ncbi:hypothetical protein OKT22_01410 [Providencia rettgeri]|uniref:hypothetical protein n=1 Tax=Providencia rettgeri TaxID=587 RepID=UPI00226FE414|nr:hypothetical protein [Providencia rettgeri]MCX9107693.1 hypothetical protein [Providencia rettgeri]
MKTVWISEKSFLKMAKIGWIDYNNARLSNNKLLGVELPETRLHGQGTKNPHMQLHEVTRFMNDYNEAKKNQHY